MRKLALFIFLFAPLFIVIPQDPKIPDGMVLIPGASFQMGIKESELAELAEMGEKVPHMRMTHSRWWFADEMPIHTVNIESFYIDIHEVTNARFRITG